MLPRINVPFQLSQLLSPEHSAGKAPILPAVSDTSQRSMLQRAIKLLETHTSRNIPEVAMCLSLLNRLLKSSSSECRQQDQADIGSANVQALQLTIRNKDAAIGQLKNRLKKLTQTYNQQLSVLLKKKIAMEGRPANFEDLFRTAKIGEAASSTLPGEPKSNYESPGNAEQFSQQNGAANLLCEQPARPLLRHFSTEPEKENAPVLPKKYSLAERQFENRICQLTGELAQALRVAEDCRSELELAKRNLRVLQDELCDQSTSACYTIQELERRLLEKELELEASHRLQRVIPQAATGSADPSEFVLKRALQKQCADRQLEMAMVQRCYISRIDELEAQLARS